jgi:hypothetical protein
MQTLPYVIVMICGMISLVMGFTLVARGIGSSDGESLIKFFALEIRSSRVGPGVIFASFGIVLTALSLWLLSRTSERPIDQASNTQMANTKTQPPGGDVTANSPQVEPTKAIAAKPSPAPATAKPPSPQVGSEQAIEIALLRRALTQTALGECPADVMGAMLRNACEQQQPNIGNVLRAKGDILGIQYVGAQTVANGSQDVFAVSFQSGKMTWMLSKSADGKLFTLAAPLE